MLDDLGLELFVDPFSAAVMLALGYAAWFVVARETDPFVIARSAAKRRRVRRGRTVGLVVAGSWLVTLAAPARSAGENVLHAVTAALCALAVLGALALVLEPLHERGRARRLASFNESIVRRAKRRGQRAERAPTPPGTAPDGDLAGVSRPRADPAAKALAAPPSPPSPAAAESSRDGIEPAPSDRADGLRAERARLRRLVVSQHAMLRSEREATRRARAGAARALAIARQAIAARDAAVAAVRADRAATDISTATDVAASSRQ